MKNLLFEITAIAKNEQALEFIYKSNEDGLQGSTFIIRQSFEDWLFRTGRLNFPIEVNGVTYPCIITAEDYWKEVPASTKCDDAAQYLVVIHNSHYSIFQSLPNMLS